MATYASPLAFQAASGAVGWVVEYDNDWTQEPAENLLTHVGGTYTDRFGVDWAIDTNGGTGLATLETNATDGIYGLGPGAGDHSTRMIASYEEILAAVGAPAWDPLDQFWLLTEFADVTVGGANAYVMQICELSSPAGAYTRAVRASSGVFVHPTDFAGAGAASAVTASVLSDFFFGHWTCGAMHMVGHQATEPASPDAMTPLRSADYAWILGKPADSDTGDTDTWTDNRVWYVLGRSAAGQVEASIRRTQILRYRAS